MFVKVAYSFFVFCISSRVMSKWGVDYFWEGVKNSLKIIKSELGRSEGDWRYLRMFFSTTSTIVDNVL